MTDDLVKRLREVEAYPDKCVRDRVLAAADALEKAREALAGTLAALAAATSLLSRSSKKAAPSDVMFDMMLKDYEKALIAGRVAFAKLFAPAPKDMGEHDNDSRRRVD